MDGHPSSPTSSSKRGEEKEAPNLINLNPKCSLITCTQTHTHIWHDSSIATRSGDERQLLVAQVIHHHLTLHPRETTIPIHLRKPLSSITSGEATCYRPGQARFKGMFLILAMLPSTSYGQHRACSEGSGIANNIFHTTPRWDETLHSDRPEMRCQCWAPGGAHLRSSTANCINETGGAGDDAAEIAHPSFHWSAGDTFPFFFVLFGQTLAGMAEG